MSRENPGSILVDYYQGSEEPIIRISTESVEMLHLIGRVFEDLSKKRYSVFHFHEIEQARFVGLQSLTLQVIEGDREPRKALECVKDAPPRSEFRWSKSSAGWDDSAWWIAGMLKLNKPGHQYLTNERGYDDALITISFREGD